MTLSECKSMVNKEIGNVDFEKVSEKLDKVFEVASKYSVDELFTALEIATERAHDAEVFSLAWKYQTAVKIVVKAMIVEKIAK